MTTTASSLLSAPLNRLRNSYARSPLPKFLAWWGDELRDMLPERFRDTLADRSSELWVEVAFDQLIVHRAQGGQVSEAGRLPITSDRRDVTRLFERLTADQEEGPPSVWLMLGADQVLQRRLSFPRAAEDNLAKVLTFEMDRQTPFKAEQVYFDYLVDPASYGERQLAVDLIVVTRDQAERSLKIVNTAGIELHGMSCWRADGSSAPRRRMDVNLLPEGRRVTRINSRLRMNLIMMLGLVLILGLVMSQSLVRREAGLEAMQTRVNEVRVQAQQVVELRLSLEEAVQGAGFLANHKASRPPLTLIMAELTDLLPDDTWLEQLQFRENTLTVRGQSPEAAKLIPLFQQARTLREAGFRDTVQTDPRTNKERFHISAETRMPEAEDADSSGTG